MPRRPGSTLGYLTISETSAAFHVSPQTIRNWIHSGRLRAYRVGPRNFRVNPIDAAELVEPAAFRVSVG